MGKSLNKAHKEIQKQKIIDKINTKLIPRIQTVYTAAIIMVLHDKYGFGVKRCGDAIEKILETFEDMYDNRISLSDIQNTISETLGIDIVEFEKRQNQYFEDKENGLNPEPIKIPKIKPTRKEKDIDCSNLRKFMKERKSKK